MDMAYFKNALLARQSLLEEELAGGDVAVVELDQSRVGRLSRMDALQGQAMAQATARRREIESLRIEAALQRIQDGEYGYCMQCGEAISEARLAYDPAVHCCVECAD